MVIHFVDYEVRALDDNYGLCGLFKTEQEALEEINYSFKNAKANGFDHSKDKWMIIKNETVIQRTENGEFCGEIKSRFVTSKALYSEIEDAFVFV